MPDTTSILPDAVAAKNVALEMCADLARDIFTHLKEDSGWQVSVSDESGKPFFRVTVVAESLE